MSDLFGNHIVGFPTRRPTCIANEHPAQLIIALSPQRERIYIHYENMPMQYTEIFKVVKKTKIFSGNI